MDPSKWTTTSIYYEALWVIVLFGATATLREAIGELCVQRFCKNIFNHKFLPGKVLDVFISCSNGGRSLGFGAAWRMWNIDKSGIVEKKLIILPFACWLVGMPIKLIAVQAVRGGNEILGAWGTWSVGIGWILICLAVKLFAIIVDRKYGYVDKNGKLVSFRKIFQNRFCRVEGYGMMLYEFDYDWEDSIVHPTPLKDPIGISVESETEGRNKRLKALHLSLKRQTLEEVFVLD